MSKNERVEPLTVVVPARCEAQRIDLTLDGLLNSEVDRPLYVVVTCNGPRDDTEARVEARRNEFVARGWELTVDRIEQHGKCAAIRHGVGVGDAGSIVILDVRVGIGPNTIGALVDGAEQRHLLLASGRLDYVIAGSVVCRAFARGYAASPFGRSDDLKGTCVYVAGELRADLLALPDVSAEDRYYVSITTRARRGAVRDAVVRYHFPTTTWALFRQQVRWSAANRATERAIGDYDRPGHETQRRPYFGDQPPARRDRIVYATISIAARIIARLRPLRGVAW